MTGVQTCALPISELITRRLGNEGYTFANVNGVPQPNPEDHTVAITFVVDPGKRAYVNRINYRGNTKSLTEALRHAGIHNESKVNIEYIDSEEIETVGCANLAKYDAILVPGGFGKRHLHAEADAQVRDLVFTGKLRRHDLAFHAALMLRQNVRHAGRSTLRFIRSLRPSS